jgi:hypothetical protein
MCRKSSHNFYSGTTLQCQLFLIYFKEDTTLRSLIFGAMKTKETGISGIATQLLAKSALSDAGLKVIFQDSLSQIQELVSSSNDTVRFRALDLIAAAASSRLEAFKICQSNGLLNAIIKSFDPRDLLQTLNFVELYDKVPFTISFMLTIRLSHPMRELSF